MPGQLFERACDLAWDTGTTTVSLVSESSERPWGCPIEWSTVGTGMQRKNLNSLKKMKNEMRIDSIFE
jgi:hypothetical protein